MGDSVSTSPSRARSSWPVKTANEPRNVRDVLNYLAASQPLGPFWDELVKWPPDVFALTSLILEESGAHHLAVSPPREFPPLDWAEARRRDGEEWRRALVSANDAASFKPPEWLASCFERLDALCALELASMRKVKEAAREEAWPCIEQLLRLHAAADEACRGFGRLSSDGSDAVQLELDANLLLKENGSLSRFHADRIRVLPKLHTPQVGMTLRSLSRHISFLRSPVGVNWSFAERLGDREDRRLNLLVIPWPLEVGPSAFRIAGDTELRMNKARFGLFSFNPDVEVNMRFFEDCVDKARSACPGPVHGVVLPESALTEDEAAELTRRLRAKEIEMVLTGVRAKRSNFARLTVGGEAGSQQQFDQYKHHRWCIDRRQVEQYGLSWQLNPHRLWWEAVDISERQLNIIASREWLSICHLICEDLARLEPVTPCIRAVGPSLVIALLQDGPQLEGRWPGRYASVLADDPGCSVLTVTSLGMALLSKSSRGNRSRSVALWKDAIGGTTQLELAEGENALLLSLTARYVEEFTADGRSDGKSAAHLVLTSHKGLQVQLPTVSG